MAMLALMDDDGGLGDFSRRPLQVFAVGAEKVASFPRDDCNVAVFQVADHVGERRKSNRVGSKVHFTPTIPHRQRRTFARSNYQIVVAFKQESKSKRSVQPRQRCAYCVDRLASFLQLLAYEMSDYLGVRFRVETGASQLKLFTQIVMIFYNAVVHDRDAVNRVRMRVDFVWTAMGRPARVADAY